MNDILRQELVRGYSNQLLAYCGYPTPNPRQARADLNRRTWRTLNDVATELYEGEYARQEGPGLNVWAQSLSSFNSALCRFLDVAVAQEFRELTETVTWCRRRTLTKFDQNIFTIRYEDADLPGSSDGGEADSAILQLSSETRNVEPTEGWSFTLPRKTMMSASDPSAFVELPRAMARRAAKALDTLVWGELTSNPTLADGVELFHADRNNLLTGSGSALSKTSLDDAITALASAVEALTSAAGLTTVPLKQSARFIIVPSALQTTALEVLTELGLIGTVPATSDYQRKPHGLVIPGIISLVVEPALDSDSTTAWYLASAPQDQGFELLSLQQDELSPRVEPVARTEILGCRFKLFLDAGVYVRHGTGIVKSTGTD